VIVEESALPFALTAARIRRLCAEHVGLGGDGILLLSEPDQPATWRGCVSSTPTLRGGAVGQRRARGDPLPAQHGWTDAARFSLQTEAGEIRATILDERTSRVDMGRARLQSPAFPGGPAGGAGELEAAGRTWHFQHVSIGNPQCAIFVERDQLERLDLAVVGAEIERHSLFPQRTNVSFSHASSADALRTRIYERGVGETLSSGTGACGAAVAHVLRGGESP